MTPIEVGKTTVFIRTNITRVETEEFSGWEYDEEQVPVTDFIARLQNEKDVLQEEVYVLQEVTFDAVTESESTKAELLVLQELVFDLIVSQEGTV
ncbi:hypothetical protein SAMN05421832_11658 [Psychrobacillus psychrodurans]|nr:hypothetical protein SAMN05421832_11658 [Psychrobacillus psychrodurans]